MAYISLSKTKGASSPAPELNPSGGYVSLSKISKPAPETIPTKPVAGEGYVSLSKLTPENTPAPIVPATPPAPVAKQSVISKVSDKVAGAIDRPAPETLTTDANKNFWKFLPSSIVESLPFGLGQAFKLIHDMEEEAQNDPNNAAQFIDNSPKALAKEVPGAVLDTAKGFVKAPISGALNVAGLTGKKIKFNIPGLGEVSNAQYRTAQRVADGENPVQVALEEGSSAILDTLFFASLVSKPFMGRPTVTAKGEVPASTFEKVQGASKSLQPKSFRLYEPKTSAQPLTPEFIEKAKAQGTDFGPNFKPERPTYFRMSYDPKGNVFRGEIVQIKPSWVSVIAKKFSGNITKAPTQALDVISAPKEVSGKAIEAGVKKPVIETKTPETTITPPAEVKTPEIAPELQNKGYVSLSKINKPAPAQEIPPFKFVPPAETPPAPISVPAENAPSKRIGMMDYHPTYTPNMNKLIKEAQDNGDLFPYTKFSPEEQKILDNAFKDTISKIPMGETKNAPVDYGDNKTPDGKEIPNFDKKLAFEKTQIANENLNEKALLERKTTLEKDFNETKGDKVWVQLSAVNEILNEKSFAPNLEGIPAELHPLAENLIKQKAIKNELLKQIKLGLESQNLTQRETVQNIVKSIEKMGKTPSEFYDIVARKLRGQPEPTQKKPESIQTQKEKVAESTKEKPKSIKEVSRETGIKEPNVRRILGVGAKEGTFERVEKGVYILSKDGQDLAYVETGDAVESLPKLAESGFKADMIFFDIPYDTPAVKGGNRGVDYKLLSVSDFGKVLDASDKIIKTPNSPIIHMFSQAPSGMKAMQKYNDLFIEKGWKPVGRGQYQKTFADGSPVTSPNGKVAQPEGILVFTKSGELDKDLKNLNFTLKRPKGYQTEKPAEMLKAMIEMTTNEGDTVLDPFAGSGVTGAEAVRAGRKAYLIEKNADVAENVTRKRVKESIESSTKQEKPPLVKPNIQAKIPFEANYPKAPSGKGEADVEAFRKDTPHELGHMEDVHPIEFPELVDLVRDLAGKVPEIRKKMGNKLGVFQHGSEKGDFFIALKADIFTDPEQAAKTLAHEIGHLIDYLPDETMARGNLLGRLQTLRKFMKWEFDSETGNIVKNSVVRDELMAVSKYWRPIGSYEPVENADGEMVMDDNGKPKMEFKEIPLEKMPKSYQNYRKSSKELYADAISMLFNTPGTLEKMAPTFYKEFFNGLDKKPDVFNAYFELQDLLGGSREEILTQRRKGVRGMFDKGDMKAADIQRARMAIKEAQEKDFMFNFKFNLIDKNQPLIDRVNKLKKEGKNVSDDENPVYYLEERNYLGGKIKSFMEKNIQPIFENLKKNEISWTDFGEALFYDRIRAGDRSDVANPRGITPKVAEELLQKQFTELGQERADILTTAMEDFRSALKDVAEEAFDEGLYKEEMHDQMMKNPAYATFQVLDHMEEGMTSKIHKSIGTLKDVSNPADASLLKTISTIRAIERNKVTRNVVEFLQKNFKEDIEDANTIATPKGKIPVESKLPFKELISYMKEGKRVGFYVDKYIQRSVENETIGHTISILRTMNSSLFRPLFITYNPGFQAFNFLRDFQRFWKNTPNMTFIKALKLYKQAIPAAKARAWGDTTNEVLQKLEQDQILSISYNQLADGAEVEDKQIDTILRSSGIDSFQPEVRFKALQPIVKVLDYIKDLGDFVETLPKVAGYLEFSKNGEIEISREQKSFIRKNIGSPDFLAGGYWKPLTNEVFLFSNAITQGIRSDVNVATDPKTRSGYWYKTAKMNLLPKIIMLLASLGFFGASIKKMMDDTSEYDKANYSIIPLGTDSKGKTIYFRVPQDETGRLLGGIAWKFLNSQNNKQGIGKDLIDILNFSSGQLPNVAPIITSAVATSQFVAGQNPYDTFRNRNVLTDDQYKAGGWYAGKPFLGWLFNQSGGGILYSFQQGAPREKSGTEKLFNLPVVGNIAGRFVKVSDYGQTETLRQITNEVQSKEAAGRIDENTIINKYIDEAHGAKNEATIEELTQKNRAKMVVEILGHAPSTPEELTKAKNIEKKYQIGLQRGESDPYINSLISATTNEQKTALILEFKDKLSKQDFNRLMLTSIKYKIVGPEAFIKAVNSASKKQ